MYILKIGDIILVKVTGINDYGFFIETKDYKGLCHVSEISNDYVSNINDFVSVGEEIYVLIKGIDDVNKHLKVSIKDINYYVDNHDSIHETRKGFLPLKEMLPIWIEEKMKEYNQEKKL